MSPLLKRSLIILWVLVPVIGIAIFWQMHDGKEKSGNYTITDESGAIQTGSIQSQINTTDTIAYISKLKGKVELRNAETLKPINLGTKLFVGDTIQTDTLGEIEIIFADNSVVRLDEKSTMVLGASETNWTEVSLINGALWARVLKPLGDSGFFTIKTSDLSAGVRGTAVVAKTLSSGKSSFGVVDSFMGTGSNEPSVMISHGSGSEMETVPLHEEEVLSTETDDKLTPKSVKKSELLADEFVRENSKEDLVYLQNLEKTLSASGWIAQWILEKISGELTTSLPKPEELNSLIDSAAIKKYTEWLIGSGELNAESLQKLIGAIWDDALHVEKLQDLARLRSEDVGTMTPEQKAAYEKSVNDLEQETRTFEETWQKKALEVGQKALDQTESDVNATLNRINDSLKDLPGIPKDAPVIPRVVIPKISTDTTPEDVWVTEPKVTEPIIPKPSVKILSAPATIE